MGHAEPFSSLSSAIHRLTALCMRARACQRLYLHARAFVDTNIVDFSQTPPMPCSCAYQTTCSTDLSASTSLYPLIPNRNSSSPSSDRTHPDLGMPNIHHGRTSCSHLMCLTAQQTGQDELEACASAFSFLKVNCPDLRTTEVHAREVSHASSFAVSRSRKHCDSKCPSSPRTRKKV